MNNVIHLSFGPTATIKPRAGRTAEQAYMARAFSLVSPEVWGQKDWKERISAVLTNADLEAACVSLDVVVEAIEFFTATKALVGYSQRLDGAPCYVIRAPGYRRGPAA